VTVGDLIAQSDAVPFVIKINIEGSEADLFAAEAYRRAMQGRHRLTHRLGENVVSIALSPQTAFHFVRKLRPLVSLARAVPKADHEAMQNGHLAGQFRSCYSFNSRHSQVKS
jgi:hypothetical protein